MRAALGLILSVFALSANAALVSRAGGLAYYDTDTDLTWVADANLAQTSGYDGDGLMTWTGAVAWIASLNAQSMGLGYLSTNDWRLPTVTDTGTAGCDFAWTGTDCGYNVDLATGEMARMFYGTLGNTGWFNASGGTTGCSLTLPQCLTNTSLFSNLQPGYYWYGNEYAPGALSAWSFSFGTGFQDLVSKDNAFYVWAVRPGDIAALVPVPGAVWLFGGALALLGAARRRAPPPPQR